MAAWFIAPAKGVLFLMVISTRGRIPGLLNLAPSGAAFLFGNQSITIA
jgi:hypothetical protein